MTTTAIAAHTVTVEPITDDTKPHAPAGATRAVVERYDGRLVKVITTDGNHLYGSTLQQYAQAAAHAYGADYIHTTDDHHTAETLLKMARLICGPYNASLPEALHLATRDHTTARHAVQKLADTLHRHPRDLALWDRTRPRDQVARIIRLAAMGVRK